MNADAIFVYITSVSGSVDETLHHHGLFSMNFRQRENRVSQLEMSWMLFVFQDLKLCHICLIFLC